MIDENDAKAAVRDMIACHDAYLGELDRHYPDGRRTDPEYLRLKQAYEAARKWLAAMLVDNRH
jgi:hypothetical protein